MTRMKNEYVTNEKEISRTKKNVTEEKKIENSNYDIRIARR